jgi:nucleoside permease NupC
MASDPPPRQRVILSQRSGARMVRTRIEVQEQTAVGDALVRGLVRAQLGLALRLAAVVICVVVAIPLLGNIFREVGALTVFGVRANWLVLGALLYPLFYLVGRVYIRLAEQGERDFMGIVDEGADDGAPRS